jgi:FdhE protein
VPAEIVQRAATGGMPPLDRAGIAYDAALQDVLTRLLQGAVELDQPEVSRAALTALLAAEPAEIEPLVRDVLADIAPIDALAEHAFVAAAVQVWLTLGAAQLDGARLVPVGTGVCPVCGGPPVASMVVGWPGAETARYCACSACGTYWNEVRIKCMLCGDNGKVAYREIDGGAGTIKAECCSNCGSYLKVLYEHRDTHLEPFADDVASLGLDLLLKQNSDFRRGGFNPFLLGL